MVIKKSSVAGTLESSDLLVTLEPGENGVTVEISSNVLNQYGKQIKKVVLDTLERLDVQSAKVTVVDKGALDCTIKARVECAVFRSMECTENIPWGGVLQK